LPNHHYYRVDDVAHIDGVEIPFCVEAWVHCKHAKKGEETKTRFHPSINRSQAIADISISANSSGLWVDGCGLYINISSAKTAHYDIFLSLITPFLRKSGDGKAPVLSDFNLAIRAVLQRAAVGAYRDMVKPPTAMSV